MPHLGLDLSFTLVAIAVVVVISSISLSVFPRSFTQYSLAKIKFMNYSMYLKFKMVKRLVVKLM